MDFFKGSDNRTLSALYMLWPDARISNGHDKSVNGAYDIPIFSVFVHDTTRAVEVIGTTEPHTGSIVSASWYEGVLDDAGHVLGWEIVDSEIFHSAVALNRNSRRLGMDFS